VALDDPGGPVLSAGLTRDNLDAAASSGFGSS